MGGLAHATVGAECTQSEFEAATLHTVGGTASLNFIRSYAKVLAANGSSSEAKAFADIVCDATSAEDEFQTALTAVYAIGGRFYAHPGSYSFDGEWADANNYWRGVYLEGAGRNGAHLSTEITYDGSADATNYLISILSTGSLLRRTGIKGINLDCNNKIGGIEVDASYAVLEDIYINDVADTGVGVYMNSDTYSGSYNILRNLEIIGQDISGGIGLKIGSNQYSSKYELVHVDSFEDGIWGRLNQGIILDSPVCETCDDGIHIVKSKGGIILNPYCEGNTTSDIHISCGTASTNLVIIGGQLSGSATYGIYIPNTANISSIILVGVYSEAHGTAGLFIASGNSNLQSVIAIGCNFSDGITDADGKLVRWDVGNGVVNRKPNTENHDGGDTLALAETGSTHTNYGATGNIQLKLPASCPVGTYYKFIVGAAHQLQVVVGAASHIIIADGTTNTDDGGNDGYLWADDEGESLELSYIAAGVWLGTTRGTWTWVQP